jgi:hypothetical protein
MRAVLPTSYMRPAGSRTADSHARLLVFKGGEEAFRRRAERYGDPSEPFAELPLDTALRTSISPSRTTNVRDPTTVALAGRAR